MIDRDSLAWDRMDGLIPAIVQDAASGALAASVFHDRRIAIGDLKDFLAAQSIEVRR